MSAILDFYLHGKPSPAGTYHEILQSDDRFWEDCHGHVQWVFMLPEASKMQPNSPVAAHDDYNTIASSPVLKMRVLAALGRYIAFLDRTNQWRRGQDHNHLRITRVIRCLCFCGLNDAAFDFCEYVKHIAGGKAGKQTVWYWEEALKRHPAWLLKSAEDEDAELSDEEEIASNSDRGMYLKQDLGSDDPFGDETPEE